MANAKGKRKTTGSGGVKTVDMTKGSSSIKRSTERGVIDNIWGICFILIGIFLFAAVRFGAGGRAGIAIGSFIKGIFGHIGLILPFYLIIFGFLLLLNKNIHISGLTAGLGALVLFMMCLINSARFIPKEGLEIGVKAFYEGGKTLENGGLLGMIFDAFLVKFIGRIGVYCLATIGILAAMIRIVNIPVNQLLSIFGEKRTAYMDKVKDERAERRKVLEEADKERRAAYERERKEAEERALRERREKEFMLKQGSATEFNLGEILQTVPADKLFPGGRRRSGGNDKVDSQDMFDLFDYSRDRGNAAATVDDRAQHFVDLLNDSYNAVSGTSGRRSRNSGGYTERSTERATNRSRGYSGSYGLEPTYVPRRGYGLDGDDYIPGTAKNKDKNARPAGKNIAIDSNPPTEPKEERRINIIPYNRPVETDNVDQGQADRPEFRDERILTADKTADRPAAQVPPAASAAAPAPTPAVAESGAPGRTKPEITNKEAENASLNPGDFNKVKKPHKYKKPSIDLLNRAPSGGDRVDENALMEKAQDLEETFKNFNVAAKVIDVTQGPAVTRYEIQPEPGVKVSKIVSLADDIALNLRAKSIRIEAPIPGKAAIGIEVENEKVNMVSLREIIESREFKDAQSKISFAVGRDITGKAIVADLKEMPHMLIAGSTGSGKSVCVNGIITSILYKADPDEVKLILIDPKQVELGNYNGIPHLLIPVVTDPSKAAAALNWAVSEMSDRYKKFADTKVKDLKHYNEYMKSQGKEEETLAQIVIIIDELADLMMAAPSQVEDSICRLAQLARAAGMHLIVATQRPSVDIVTGLIKANIPSRIAFAVASQFDSRTILDMSGAEKLVGKGDMLYSPVGMAKPLRVQGCFIDESETNRILEFVKGQAEAEYDDSVAEVVERGNVQSVGSMDNKDDALIQDAVEFVISQGKASTSLIQRRFRIGYNRAANIIDELERMGVIGPQDGSKAREVKWTEADYNAYRGGDSEGNVVNG